jgi:DNA modification methylase
MTGTTPIDTIIQGDALTRLKELPSESVDCCITSPPYFGLRDYGVEGQIGLEESPEAYVSKLVDVFREVRRVLKKEGTLWLNLGDSYAGSGKGGQSEEKRSENWQPQYGNKGKRYGLKPKDLIGIPWMVAFALRADGWWLRSDIIWHKPNCMPESVTDRPTKSHEYMFLLSKSKKYYYDAEVISEDAINTKMPGKNMRDTRETYGPQNGGNSGLRDLKQRYKNGDWPTKRNKRTVWTVATKPYSEAHFATFPEKLIEPCILAGCPEGGICLDPFFGAGTTGLVAKKLGRHFIGIELNEAYIGMAQKRIAATPVRLDNWM